MKAPLPSGELSPLSRSRVDSDGGQKGERPEVRRVLIFITISLALFMMSVDSTIVATALHALQHGLKTSINWASWTITAFSLGYILMVPMSGKLSDWLGRRRVFLSSVVVFTATSLCCGLVNNVFVLIALRALQAAGGAGFTPSATGIVVEHFGQARDRAVSLFGSIFPTGAMVGPIFGGLFVSYWSWRGVFFVNVPIGMLLIVFCLRFVPRDPTFAKATHGTLDVVGMAFLGIGVLSGMFAVAHLGEHGSSPGSPLFIAPILVAVIAIASFIRHAGRKREPFIAPRFIYGAHFGPVNLINAIFGGVSLAVIALLPLYAANRYGLDALRSGILLVAQGVAAISLSILGTIALRRTGYRSPLYAGSILIALGILMLAVHPIAMPAFAWLSVGALVLGIGAGTINPASRNAGLQISPGDSSTIAALRSMCLQIGMLSTVSIATAVIARGSDPGMVQAWLYAGFAALMIVSLPLIARIPEHRGSW